jgi:hypothetical protein
VKGSLGWLVEAVLLLFDLLRPESLIESDAPWFLAGLVSFHPNIMLSMEPAWEEGVAVEEEALEDDWAGFAVDEGGDALKAPEPLFWRLYGLVGSGTAAPREAA